MPPPDENPYVGPRPFDAADARLFFGRDREVAELVALIVSNQLVVLYSASGAGKSSLLNAAVIGRLERDEEFEVLPVARVRGISDRQEHTADNVFAASVVSHITGGAANATSLGDYLAGREHRQAADGFPSPRVLVIDQFEEVFTAYPEHWRDREGFFGDLGSALRDNPLLRIVLAIREDFLAQLDPYARLLPTNLRAGYRLERLGPGAALRAAKEPARNGGRPFSAGVAEHLVEDLLTVRVDSGHGPRDVVGEYVEPVQLQVACRSLWEALPPGATEITEEHRERFGDVDELLGQFYDQAVGAAAVAARMREASLRSRLADRFITPLGTRGTVFWTSEQTGGIPARAIDELDKRHLIRAELRARARWYELTHDRLIEPIRASNREYETRRRDRRRRRVAAPAAVVGVTAATAAAALAFVAGGGEGAAGPTTIPRGPAQISFVDVGQGDAVVMRIGGKTIVSDAGELDPGRVDAALRAVGAKQIDVAIMSHPHQDHIANFVPLMQEFGWKIAQVVLSNTTAWQRTQTNRQLIDLLNRRGVPLRYVIRGDRFDFGGATWAILNPPFGVYEDDLVAVNNASVVYLLTVNGVRALFTGDVEENEAKSVARELDKILDKRVHIFLATNQGSRHGSPQELLSVAKPRWAVLSVGENPFNHPAPETVARLHAAGATIWCTDTNGTTTVHIGTDGRIEWEPSRQRDPWWRASEERPKGHCVGR